MNSGIVSYRYASALLKYADETGNGEIVYRQVVQLSKELESVSRLRALIDNPSAVPGSMKTDLCEAALGGNMADELKKFIRLVIKNKRMKYLRFILFSFISQYRKTHKIKVCRLVTAVPSDGLEKRIASIVEGRTGDSVVFEHRVDPEIIGGFVVELGGYRMDASTVSQLKAVRRQFIEKNRRIV